MPTEGIIALCIVVAVVIAMATNRVPVETAMLGGLLAQILAGVVDAQTAFSGFAHPAIVAIGALFIIAAGLFDTGATAIAANVLLGRPKSVRMAQFRLIFPVTVLSAFINNTPVVAMFLPIVRDWSKRIGVKPSQLLIPLSFSSILGGQLTLIGSASNLIVMGLYVEYLAEVGLDAPVPYMQFWGPALLGLPLATVGLLYLALASSRLLPERGHAAEDWRTSRNYTIQVEVLPGSKVVGKSIEQAGLRNLRGLFLFEIDRNGVVVPAPGPDMRLAPGDRLAFTGVRESIIDLQKIRGLKPVQLQDEEEMPLSLERELVEAVIPATSVLTGRTVREARFRSVYNAAVVAVHRAGVAIERKIGDIVISPGDTVLLQAPPGFAQQYRGTSEFCLISRVVEVAIPRYDRMWKAVLICVGMLLAVMFTSFTPAVVCLVAALMMVLTKCVSLDRATASVPLRVIVAIAAALGMGAALEQSGAAAAIAEQLLNYSRAVGMSDRGMLLMMVLTASAFAQVITKNGAAALVFPIAMASAESLGLHPAPFAFSLIVGCGLSFLSPISYQTNLMVYGPGGYRFMDFPKVGLPLTLILAALCALLCPIVFPFQPLA